MLHHYLKGDGQPGHLGRLARQEPAPSTRSRVESLSRSIRAIEQTLGSPAELSSRQVDPTLVEIAYEYPKYFEELDRELRTQEAAGN